MRNETWTYNNPVRILFDIGAARRLSGLVEESRVLVVTSAGFRRRGLVDNLEQTFGKRIVAVLDDVAPNPDVRDIQAQAERVRREDPAILLAVGGGSVIDTAKALAKLLGLPAGTALDALLAGTSRIDVSPALPVIAVPTTAGTGAEVTPFGTVWDRAGKKKHSLAANDLFPQHAILDPELTLGLPESVTVASGLDAVSHALESSWNRNATPVSIGLATRSLQQSIRNLPRVVEQPDNIEARAAMIQASTLAGLAISQSRTALAHAISYPVTSNFELPHGLACSFTLPALLRFNAAADDGRLQDLARSVGFRRPSELAEGLSALFEKIDVSKHVSRFVPDKESVLALSNQMFAPGRAENNLRDATEADVRSIVTEALDELDI